MIGFGLEWRIRNQNLLVLDQLRLSSEQFLSRKNLKIKSDLKFLSTRDFQDFPGGKLLLDHFYCLPNYFRRLYGLPLNPLDIDRISRNHWSEKISRKFFFEFISCEIPSKIRRQCDWAFVDEQVVRDFNGTSLLISDSLNGMLRNAFPEFFWEKQFRYQGRVGMDAMVVTYFGEVRRRRDLERLTAVRVGQCPGGQGMLWPHQGGLQGLLGESYPELALRLPWESRGYWTDLTSNNLVQRTMRFYDIRRKKDWYRLSNEQFSLVHGKEVLRSKMVQLLSCFVPEEEWKEEKFSECNKRARQRFLGLRLKELFKGEVMYEDYVFSCSDRTWVFDYYLPGLDLVIEYQGEQHYCKIGNWVLLEEQQRRDAEKKEICVLNGFKMVEVPYWWDLSLQNLKTILNIS
eukprot:TRINITY_DN9409_c0_g1_i1.p1 TRINITY_DN9409_c0_g1~~TRINITY_DN9409_c0_g1_i1.p1  ORF type:complete len:402 (+),score=34.23 TRINITY_DN9409_c0_g1_i1:178-1383(+)